eukprot:CAMPEP_0118979076 /NCGR_PEP_ID=MMETSP1173-20130426/25113_1 /TAXON_ID=1034831 /ORGANISM="Rhizochromulina marina cf, Strain CCMP1243" /LENGTH=238 /DNA_ID=CAMNT_0006929319 /DNA_START=1 /DNA_END=714 /DNA_ORIENTATION=+
MLVVPLLSLVLIVAGDGSGVAESEVNERLVLKRRAKEDARQAFDSSHQAAFDEYGRLIRYGHDIDRVECSEHPGPRFSCRVTEYSPRKYLTREERLLAQQIRADKQEEIDSSFGLEGPGAALRRQRVKKEQKAKCALLEEWLAKFQADSSPQHRGFFAEYLASNYEDYSALRAIAERGKANSRTKRKAKTLKRHIALHVHEDKLPPMCRTSDLKDMSATIQTHVQDLEDCIHEPHKCT